MNILFNKEHQILYLLAKRSHPELYSGWLDFDPLYDIDWTCLICDNKFPVSSAPADHGLMHLKEHNLLPFI